MISDSYCRYILTAIESIPKPCTEVSVEYKIPIDTVYRRMQHLRDEKLVHVSDMINNDGKKYFLYKSKISSTHATFDNKLTVTIIYS